MPQHESPRRLMRGVRRSPWCLEECGVLVVGIGESAIEPGLLAGRIRCPDCGAPLAPWGHAREREVRMRYGGRLLRPRRGRCGPCDATHVVLPATVVPRRRDCTEVIGQALFAAACGAGHRTIAAELDRAPGTVRGWLRAFGRRAETIGRCGSRWAVSLGEELPRRWPAESPVAYGVEALRWAYAACVERFGRIADFWELLVAMTGGYLLRGRPRDPPDFPRCAELGGLQLRLTGGASTVDTSACTAPETNAPSRP